MYECEVRLGSVRQVANVPPVGTGAKTFHQQSGYQRKGAIVMKRMIILPAVALWCVAGCVYESPLTEEHTIAVDEAVLGLWEEQPREGEQPGGGEDGEPAERLNDPEVLGYGVPDSLPRRQGRDVLPGLPDQTGRRFGAFNSRSSGMRTALPGRARRTFSTVASYQLKNGPAGSQSAQHRSGERRP